MAPNWKLILRRAWSIRLLLLAGVLTGLEAALPLLSGFLPIPPGVLALASFFVIGGAFVARLLAQSNME